MNDVKWKISAGMIDGLISLTWMKDGEYSSHIATMGTTHAGQLAKDMQRVVDIVEAQESASEPNQTDD